MGFASIVRISDESCPWPKEAHNVYSVTLYGVPLGYKHKVN